MPNPMAFEQSAILVVEDEPVIRMTLSDALRETGLNVIEAGNADEAIFILSTRVDIRVVVTDVEMPGSMDGTRLARLVRDRWPLVQIIVTSGKQRLAERLFELLDPGGDRRLRRSKLLGRRPKTPQLNDPEECFELPDIHMSPCSFLPFGQPLKAPRCFAYRISDRPILWEAIQIILSQSTGTSCDFSTNYRQAVSLPIPGGRT